ncbi:MAG: hypothetical protein IJW40_06555 [Clostridia bacterium]|nr:hypothetical protein [Clostridia bacterium]
MKIFLKTLSAFLAVLMVLGTLTSLTVLNVSAAATDEEATEEEVITAADIDYVKEVFNTPEEVLEYMTLYMENDNYAMYFNEFTGAFAVVNKITGQISLSNPYDVASSIGSESTKNSVLSQIIIRYTDNDNPKLMNSYEHAAVNGQIKVKKIKTGVRVEYTIGNEATRKLAPRLISATNFQTLIMAPLEEAIGGTHPFTRFSAFYTLQSLSTQNSTKAKEGLLKQYPVCANMDIYSLDADITPVELSFIEENIKGFCPDYTFDQMDADHAETGYESENELSPVFKMALEYALNEDGFTVRLPSNGVRFNSTLYSLEYISVLPYMGAGNSYNTGYTFYPDGSGALFAFEDLAGKSTYTASRKIYGLDFAYHQLDGKYQKAITMPVFGVKEDQLMYVYETMIEETNDETGETVNVVEEQRISTTVVHTVDDLELLLDADVTAGLIDEYSDIKEVVTTNGYFAVIEEGESLTELATYHAGSLSDYHTMMNYFNPRPKDTYNLGDSISVSGSQTLTVVSDRKYTGNLKIRYFLLSDETLATETGFAETPAYYEADYMGMADAYSDYLINKGILSRLTADDILEDYIPLYIESFGALEVTEQIMSFPVDVMKPLTTFDDVIAMYEELSDAGIKNINFKLTGFANGGMYATAPTKIKWEKAVGGEDGMITLLQRAQQAASDGEHLGVYPEFEMLYLVINELFDGISQKRDCIRTIDNRYTSKSYYYPSQQAYVSTYNLALSPAYIDRIYNKMLAEYAEYTEYGGMGVSLATMGSDLNTDFDEDEPYNREDSKAFIISALDTISNDASVTGGIMADLGNAYTLQYIDHLLNVNLDSSRFMKASYSVPFIGLVLHGYVQFTGNALNMEGDANYAMLKAIENGAALYYVMSYRNTAELKEAGMLSQYYSVNYAIWKDDVVEQYAELNSVLADVQTKLIIDHEFLSGMRVLDVDELIAEIESTNTSRSEFEAQYEEQLRLEKINAIAEARAAAKNGVEIMQETLKQLETDMKSISSAVDKVTTALNTCSYSWDNYQEALAEGNETNAKRALKNYNINLNGARNNAVEAITLAMASIDVHETVLALVEQANQAVELLEEAGASDALIQEAESCAASTLSYLGNIESKVNECQRYIDEIYAAAEEGGLSREEIDEYLEEEEEEEEVVDRFFVDNNIVAVTYGEDDGTAYKTFILNYNNFAVTVEYTIGDEVRLYTIPGSEYVEIYY